MPVWTNQLLMQAIKICETDRPDPEVFGWMLEKHHSVSTKSASALTVCSFSHHCFVLHPHPHLSASSVSYSFRKCQIGSKWTGAMGVE